MKPPWKSPPPLSCGMCCSVCLASYVFHCVYCSACIALYVLQCMFCSVRVAVCVTIPSVSPPPLFRYVLQCVYCNVCVAVCMLQYVCVAVCMLQCVLQQQSYGRGYGLATISRLLKITGLFCKRAL